MREPGSAAFALPRKQRHARLTATVTVLPGPLFSVLVTDGGAAIALARTTGDFC